LFESPQTSASIFLKNDCIHSSVPTLHTHRSFTLTFEKAVLNLPEASRVRRDSNILKPFQKPEKNLKTRKEGIGLSSSDRL
jgi:hypothetical protein